MQIISGRFKGKVIKLPKGIRPTQNKVRKAVFDILGDIEEFSFLELFAGSGVIGLEALSQGASEVVFVEKDKRCTRIIKENLLFLAPEAPKRGVLILSMDVLRAIPLLFHRKQKFDIIFLDPPYYGGKAKKTLQSLRAYDILSDNGFCVCQHYKKDILGQEIDNLALFKQSRFGDTSLSLYRKIKP